MSLNNMYRKYLLYCNTEIFKKYLSEKILELILLWNIQHNVKWMKWKLHVYTKFWIKNITSF